MILVRLSRFVIPCLIRKHFNRRQEIDQLKRDICQKEGIILIEIYQELEQSEWVNQIIKQIEEQRGIRLIKQDIEALTNFPGNKDT